MQEKEPRPQVGRSSSILNWLLMPINDIVAFLMMFLMPRHCSDSDNYLLEIIGPAILMLHMVDTSTFH